MELPRRAINAIGSAVVTVIFLGGTLLMVVLSSDSHTTAAYAEQAGRTNREAGAHLVDLAHQEVMVPWLKNDLNALRKQITAADELRDASALASSAAKSSGARLIAITFAERQVFAAPTGAGLGDDGTPDATTDPNTPQVQIPVSFEVEVSNTAQAAAFIDGLRGGPRLLQVVQAESSPTNDPRRLTVTVDALLFAAKE